MTTIENGILYTAKDNTNFIAIIGNESGTDSNAVKSGISLNIIIPERVTINNKKYTVNTIGRYAFRCYRELKSLYIPKTIECIGEFCFDYCTSLSKVIFSPQSKLKEISQVAFFNCIFETIVIPPTVEVIGKFAFSYCSRLQKIYYCGKVQQNEMLFDYSPQTSTTPTSLRIIVTSSYKDGPSFGQRTVASINDNKCRYYSDNNISILLHSCKKCFIIIKYTLFIILSSL